ncbi:MAG: SBBP repeat-containing protein [Myxococcota bacterium]
MTLSPLAITPLVRPPLSHPPLSHQVLWRLALGSALALPACNPSHPELTEPLAEESPRQVSLPGQEIFPEGITVDRSGSLYVGSMTQGTIFRAEAGAEQAEAFIDNVGAGVIGLLADDDRDLLWVCQSNPLNSQTPPSVMAYGLAEGDLRSTHAFPGDAGLCNDITLDSEGNVYVSDSFGHRILRIPAPGVERDGVAETWLDDPQLEVPEGTFGVNGLVVDDGALFVVLYETGRLLEAPLLASGQPSAVTEVELERPLSRPDGMKRESGGSLLVVEGGEGRLSRLEVGRRSEGPVAVEPVLETLDSPTTVALHEQRAWVVVSQFDHLFGVDPSPASAPFFVVGYPLADRRQGE